MHRRTKRTVAVAIAGAVIAAGTGTAIAAGGDGDRPVTGKALERAGTTARQHVGGGRVTEAEAGDAGSAYEVEITLADGRQVEVQLDARFDVIGTGGDDGTPDDGGPDDAQG